MPNRASRSSRARVLTALAIALPVVAAAALVQTNAFASPKNNGGENSKNTDLKSYVCAYVNADGLWKLRNGNNPAEEKNTVLLNTRDTSATTYVGQIFNQGKGKTSVKLYVLQANVTDKSKFSDGDLVCPEWLGGTPTSPATSPSNPETSSTSPTTSVTAPPASSTSPTTSVTAPPGSPTSVTVPPESPTSPATSVTVPPESPTSPATSVTVPPASPTSSETSVTVPPASPTSSETSVTAPPASPTSSASIQATSLPKTGN